MTNYVINSAFVSIEGTNFANDFSLNTALEVSLYGLAGNDTMSGAGNVTTFKRASLLGGDGNDLIRFTGGPVTASLGVVNLGDGADTFTAEISDAPQMSIFGGNGNDQIVMRATGTLNVESSRIVGGQGTDVLNLEAVTGSNFLFAGGGEDDSITFSGDAGAVFASGTIAGGGGTDIISGEFVNALLSGFYIAGDDPRTLQASYDGNDTLIISGAGNFAASTINGQAGRDSIVVDAIGTANLINGNSDNDTISIASSNGLNSGVNSTIAGGAGSDLINLGSFSGVATGLLVQGGGDNDTIILSAITGNSDVMSIYGGDGADKFDLSADIVSVASGGLGIFSYSSMSESTANARDFYSGVGTAGLDGLRFYVGGVSGSIAESGTTTSNGNYVISGVAYFTSTFSTDVSARVAVIDALVTTNGAAVLFSDSVNSQNDFLFVQGGSTDLVVQFAAASATGLQVVSAAAGGTVFSARFA